jgi:L-amino acid N-acyltransferase YncA
MRCVRAIVIPLCNLLTVPLPLKIFPKSSIYTNCTVVTRESTCDVEPVTVASRESWFAKHSGSRRPIWVAEDKDAPEHGVIGYAGFYYFMNDRPGYFITSDLAIYLHPDHQGKGLGSYLLSEAISHAPSLGIEVLAVTIMASNQASIRLFKRHGFERWGHMPRVARLGQVERSIIIMGLRLSST